jgi:GDPmannose 4,6-dehydratase
MKIGVIFGITGQDGSYLAELLLEKKYEVWGQIRRSSSFNTSRIDHIFNKLNLIYGDLSDENSINNIFNTIYNKYDNIETIEVYNLAAMSHVKVSFEMPIYTGDVDGLGTTRILEHIRQSKYKNKIKFYQASTSELYGLVQEIPQRETTPFYPRSPYACAKLYSYWITKNYREAYNLYTVNGILFNHESPRRGETFVTHKIIKAIKNIIDKKQDILYLGNIESLRDWGHAKDYVYGMWLMLQNEECDDYVLATGKQISVKEFVEKSFKYKNIDIKWRGEGLNEEGYDNKTNQILVKIDKKYYRPSEVETLLGDASKANNKLNWYPKYNIDELIKDMFESN